MPDRETDRTGDEVPRSRDRNEPEDVSPRDERERALRMSGRNPVPSREVDRGGRLPPRERERH